MVALSSLFSFNFFVMAEFDSEVLLQEQNAHLEQENQQLKNAFQNQSQEINNLRSIVQQPTVSSSLIHKSLNLPTPPRFFGTPSELNSFKLRLCQYLGSNMDVYIDSRTQILFAGSLLDGRTGR